MQRLFDILRHFREYVVLTLLLLVSLTLLGLNDNAQLHAIRSYTVGFLGIMQDAASVIPNFFELKRENDLLRQLNVTLSDEVSRLRASRLENMRLRSMLDLKERSQFKFVASDVIGTSTHLLRNTITLDVGRANGIRSDMPIISESGLVGKIIVVSDHYAIGQPMYNKDFRASAKVLRSGVDGIILWTGGATVQLKNVAKKQDVREGDIIVTSEYSNLYPKNLKIGTVTRVAEKPGSLMKEIEVMPTVDFGSLEQVFVILTVPDPERRALEQQSQGVN
jgi:rod shape-determining protein MreC